ncbi:hypothetical protein [Chondrinema litorale]|uniref:hypothetical protein n=1 Tax=Chondrinema litorale TaxID=2994555 RepID=UPI002542B441|nr:hypothetical protein [Chondrinema litorale]UZR95079.1 hypothetical protein OQ292_04520 [Chondrinema litorale]
MTFYRFTPNFGEEKDDFLSELSNLNISEENSQVLRIDKLYNFLLTKDKDLNEFFKSFSNDGEQVIVSIQLPDDLYHLPWRKCAEEIEAKYDLLISFSADVTNIPSPIYADSPANYLRIKEGSAFDASFDIPNEAKKLKEFLVQKRVVVLDEKEGRSHHWLIRLALGGLREEKKNLVPFYFNESHHSYHEAFSAIYSFLTEIHELKGLKDKLDKLKNTHERLVMLTRELHKVCFPVFVFENISSWFDSKGKPYYTHRDITDWLYVLAGNGGEHLIITNKNVTGEIARLPKYTFDKNSFDAYLQKAITLLKSNESEETESISIGSLKQLWQKSAGSEVILKLLCWLVTNKRAIKNLDNILDVELSKGLEKKHFLEQLFPFLLEEEVRVLGVLAHFHMPVSAEALATQNVDKGAIQFLEEFPLIDKFLDSQHDATHYYLSESCRVFFFNKYKEQFDHFSVGKWHQSQLEEQQRGLTHLKEAYRHFLIADTKDKIQQTAAALTIHYYKAGNYPVSHYYGLECYQKYKEETSDHILNSLALIFKKYKKNEESLFFFKILHEKYQTKESDKKYIKILNYMSMLSFELKEMEDYVNYGLEAYKLAMSLKDSKEIYNIGKSLGRFLYVGGQKQGGLKMMQHSYHIGVSKGYADVAVLEMFLREMGEM